MVGKTVYYNPERGFSLADIKALVLDEAKLSLSEEALQKVDRAFRFLDVFSKDKVIYGINTGFSESPHLPIQRRSALS